MVCDKIKNLKLWLTKQRLNPYSIGIWSVTIILQKFMYSLASCLNPYSIGIWSVTYFHKLKPKLNMKS